MTGAIKEALAFAGALFKWLIDPERLRRKDEADKKKSAKDFSVAVANGDHGSVYDRIKRLCDKAKRRRLQDSADKKR